MEPVDKDREFVATRVNHQPASLLGIASSELTVLLIIACSAGVVVAVGGFFVGLSVFSPLVAMLLSAAIVMIGAARLRAVKRNRPDRYYIHWVWYNLAKRIPGMSGKIVMRSGIWSNGRNRTNNMKGRW